MIDFEGGGAFLSITKSDSDHIFFHVCMDAGASFTFRLTIQDAVKLVSETTMEISKPVPKKPPAPIKMCGDE